MDFPIDSLLDEQACYEKLVRLPHPDGPRCPRGHGLDRCGVHKRHRAPVLTYRCKACGCCFNAFTGTRLHRTGYRPGRIVQMLRGVAQGVSTAQLSREMGIDRGHLLGWRHRMQEWAERARPAGALGAEVSEADEMYQNAGEKRHPAPRPGRPAAASGQQANRPRDVGHGSAAGVRAGGPRRRGDPPERRGARHAGGSGAARA